jgi:predicted nucleotidyltransferase
MLINNNNLLPLIKAQVHKILPDAQVVLFGSQATGQTHNESDWDILILTKQKYAKSTKWLVLEHLSSLSIEFATFINLVMVQEDEWKSNAAYYSLRTNIGTNMVVA